MPTAFEVERASVRGPHLGLTGDVITLTWDALCESLHLTPTTPGYAAAAQVRMGQCLLRTDEGVLVSPYADCRDRLPAGVTQAVRVVRIQSMPIRRR